MIHPPAETLQSEPRNPRLGCILCALSAAGVIAALVGVALTIFPHALGE